MLAKLVEVLLITLCFTWDGTSDVYLKYLYVYCSSSRLLYFTLKKSDALSLKYIKYLFIMICVSLSETGVDFKSTSGFRQTVFQRHAL